MDTVVSRDGTQIAYDRLGAGPAVIMVGAALSQRRFDPLNEALAEALAARFTVYRYDRRGRGDSGFTAPYAVEREIEDIDALVTASGGTAYVYGISSGAVLALEAARRLPGITKLAMYEPPFIVDDSRPPLPADYVERLDTLVAEGRRGDAVELFLTAAVGMPAEYVAPMRAEPFWAGMEAVAHTISHDGRIVRDSMAGTPLPAEWATLDTPTLVADGGATEPFLSHGADTLGALLPHAVRRTLPGQTHAVEAAALAPVLTEFFAG